MFYWINIEIKNLLDEKLVVYLPQSISIFLLLMMTGIIQWSVYRKMTQENQTLTNEEMTLLSSRSQKYKKFSAIFFAVSGILWILSTISIWNGSSEMDLGHFLTIRVLAVFWLFLPAIVNIQWVDWTDFPDKWKRKQRRYFIFNALSYFIPFMPYILYPNLFLTMREWMH
jgi:hypothetical protein